MVNHFNIVNRFVLHTLHYNITQLDNIARKITKKMEKLNVNGLCKRAGIPNVQRTARPETVNQ